MGTATKKREQIKRYWPFLVIIALWFAFSVPYFITHHVPFPSKYLVTFFPPWSASYGMPVKNNAMPDVITQIYPWKQLTIDTWKSGQIPLWNPYSFGGTPHAGNVQTAVFSPINLLFFILPFVDAWSVMILLQPLLAGLFMVFFLKSLGRSGVACTIGGISFMFCGFLVVWMAYGTLGYAVLVLPLLLTCIEREFQKRSWWNHFFLSIGLAWSFFSGHFQMSVYVAMITLAYLAYLHFRYKQRSPVWRLLFFYGLGILLSLPQLTLAFHSFNESIRKVSFSTGGGIAWNYLITLFAPDFFGNPVTRNDWFGYYAEWASYIGVGGLLFGLFEMIFGTLPRRKFFIFISLIVVLFATASPFSEFLVHAKIPALSTSIVSRAIVLFSFTLAVLASMGVDDLVMRWNKNEKRPVIIFLGFVGVMISMIWLVTIFGHILTPDKIVIAKRNLLLPTAVAGILGVIAMAGFMRFRFIRSFLLFILLCMVGFDMYRYASKWMPFDPREYMFPQTNIITYLQSKIGINRIISNMGGEVSVYYRIPYLEGYDAVYQQRYGEFIRSVSRGAIEEPERSVVRLEKYGVNTEKILSLLGVRYYVHRLSDGRYSWAYPYWTLSNYQSMYKDETYEIYENVNALPRFFLASSYQIEHDDSKIIQALFSNSFVQRERVILEKKPTIEPQPGPGEARLLFYSPNSISIRTKSEVSKLLFLSDVYDPGWHVSVDGKSAEVLRADYDFRTVAVPAGDHRIDFWYMPAEFIFSFFVFIVSLGILVMGTGKYFYEYRHL